MRRGVSFGALLALLACGGEREHPDARRFATALCGAFAECNCVEHFDSVAACEDDFAARVDAALDDGLKVARECFDRLITNLIENPCVPSAWDGAGDFCSHLVGSKGEGEACTSRPDLALVVNECAEPLRCFDGVCELIQPPVTELNEGDVCDANASTSCISYGLFCGSDGTCHVLQPLGEPCEDFGCEPPLYCAGAGDGGVGACSEQVPVGEACAPLDFNGCEDPEPEGNAWCESVQGVCVVGESFCEGMNLPQIWR